MKILIAPDKFKGSLSATRVAKAISKGIRKTHPNAQIELRPMADGGDGSIDLLNEVWGLTEHEAEVLNPLGKPMNASYFSAREEAFIELAKVSGLALLKEEERNPWRTTTGGTGLLMLDAIERGIKNINLFIGGSATNDAGTGIAMALGFVFFKQTRGYVIPCGGGLKDITGINKPWGRNEKNLDINLKIICDVNNPFYGKNGAAYVYARQKGADDQMIEKLDLGLKHFNSILMKEGYPDVSKMPGAGAAGGVGGGLHALFGAELIAGIDFFIELFDLEEQVKKADFVISGEGQLDSQSLQGKVVGGISKLCEKYGKPLMVVCGKNKLEENPREIRQVNSIMEMTNSIEDAMTQTTEFLEKIGESLKFHKLDL